MTVIGGADGPTAVYVAVSFHWPVIIGAIAVIAAIFIIVKMKQKNRH